MARIALAVGGAILGAAISVATGGLGTFAVGAWAADILAGASVGASIGEVDEESMFRGQRLIKEMASEIEPF